MQPILKFENNYRFLSNFLSPKVKLGTIWFPTVEHAYQAAKTRDLTARAEFAYGNLTAGDAKRQGNALKGMRPNWDMIKLDVMACLVRQKFLDQEYLEKLLATEDAKLVEGNFWHDNFWGDCMCLKCKAIADHQNNLGKLLMTIRQEMQGFNVIFNQKLIIG